MKKLLFGYRHESVEIKWSAVATRLGAKAVTVLKIDSHKNNTSSVVYNKLNNLITVYQGEKFKAFA